MALKIKQNGKVKDLIIPACGVQILDMEDNFESSNLEEVLQEIGEGESVYISDKEPDKDGIWISSDNTTISGENQTLLALKNYLDEKLGTAELTTDDKTIKGAINEHEIQINNNTEQLKDLRNEVTQLSNPNLLINSDFQVWQRGTSFSGDNNGINYTVDRWRMTSDGGIKVAQESYGVSVETTRVGTWHNFEQVIELPKYLKGKTVTASIKLHSEGTIKQFYAFIKNANGENEKTIISEFGAKTDFYTKTFTIPTGDYALLYLGVQTEERIGAKLEIEYIKLEVGSKATPFVPRSYGEELALCQRYYQTIRFLREAYSPSTIPIGINFPVHMRVTPTVYINSHNNTPYNTIDRFGSGQEQLRGTVSYNINERSVYDMGVSVGTFTKGLLYGGILKLEAEIY